MPRYIVHTEVATDCKCCGNVECVIELQDATGTYTKCLVCGNEEDAFPNPDAEYERMIDDRMESHYITHGA